MSRKHPLSAMSPTRSAIVNALEGHALERSTDDALVFLGPDSRPAGTISYGELSRRAGAFAARLLDRPDPARPVLLLIRPEADSVAALCGCLYAGVPCAPVPTPGRNGALGRLSALAEASGADVGVASGELDHIRRAAPALSWIDAAAATEGLSATPRASPDDLALIQFTSGSTVDPKGVELTHANVAANLDMLRVAFEIDKSSRFASWLPLFHDMGLAMLLMPLYFGVPGVLMPPLAFIRRPSRWLRMIHDHRATITGAPNFAFDLCVDRATMEDCESLDLSCCRIAFCGAEPVRRRTMRRFAERYGAKGLVASALFPCYGLAEAVCFVAGARLVSAEGDELEGSDPVPCGPAATASIVAIVEPDTSRALRQGETGEVWIAGPHVGRGYRGLAAESAASFAAQLDGSPAPYLRTGDLGYVDALGRLVLVGRAKDVLIHRGANIHADDLEALVAASHPSFAPTGAAFSVPGAETEVFVVVQEAARGGEITGIAAMRVAALEAVAAEYGVRLNDLVLVRPGALPKTSSGKVRREATRALYLNGALVDLFKGQSPQAPTP